jgi:exopolysaccharide biosynthesis polyprenyl glycosylphosphotransferase
MASAANPNLGPGVVEADAGVAVAALQLPTTREYEAAPALGQGDARGPRLRRLLVAVDIAALCAAFLVTELAFSVLDASEVPLLVLSVPLWVLLAYGHRLYYLDSHRADYRVADEIGPVLQMATLWSWSILLVLHVGGWTQVPVSRVASFWALTVVLLTALRSGARAVARRQPWYVQEALVIGPAEQASVIMRKIARHPEWGINATACLDVPAPTPAVEHEGPLDVDGLLPGDAALIARVRSTGVDRVILSPALSESRQRVALVSELTQLGIHVDLVPSWSDVLGARLELHEMEGMPLLTLPRPRLGRTALHLKRAVDLVSSAFAIVGLAPVLAVCAVAIKLDSPGPVLFRQRRVGRANEPFELLKFRSMCVEADTRKHEVARLNLHGGGTETGMFKIRQDPRITRVGGFLRRYSLDELPQLFNIVRGEMSFVGPRPLIENEDRQVEGRFRRRLGITPGLTGLWQVHGRSEIPFDEMVTLDYLYVTNWSLWGDAKLLMRTVSAVLRGRGAY